MNKWSWLILGFGLAALLAEILALSGCASVFWRDQEIATYPSGLRADTPICCQHADDGRCTWYSSVGCPTPTIP